MSTAKATRPKQSAAAAGRQPTTQAPGRQRATRQAHAIEAALAEADGFRTAHDLFTSIRAGGERIGLTTVYRHLSPYWPTPIVPT
jgi:Fe2+ or Zn2+ uptake regulation protein